MATTSIKEVNGAGAGTPTTTTAIRLCTADNPSPGINNPLFRPTSGTNRSFWKSIYLNADTSPSNVINNIKFYTDGSVGATGLTIKVGTKSSYTQATGTVGVTGNDASSALSITMTNAQTYTSSSPLSVSGTINYPNTGRISDYIIIQAEVTSSATVGTVPSETFTIQYDET